MLNNVSIIGAAGKMGKGIAALVLQEMAKSAGNRALYLIDVNPDHFSELRHFLQDHLLKYAEKNINELRELFKNDSKLISNKEIIDAFTTKAFDFVHFSDSITAASSSTLIFEAIVEDINKKSALFTSLKKQQKQPTFYFTNTSSIPIHELNDLSGLEGYLIGFHFYNPPVLQKVIELVVLKNSAPGLERAAEELVKRLNKVAVISNDIAGFIGNGYIMPEIIYACQMADEFGKNHTDAESLYFMNFITKDYLLRRLGIFQLMDYIGIDVVQSILKVMKLEIPERVNQILLQGKKGGQTVDGKQLDGFFQYNGLIPKAVYSLQKKSYIPLKDIEEGLIEYLGLVPNISWKSLQNDPKKEEKIQNYFERMQTDPSYNADIARKFLQKSKEIVDTLVSSHVANSRSDVNEVLQNGFYYLYRV